MEKMEIEIGRYSKQDPMTPARSIQSYLQEAVHDSNTTLSVSTDGSSICVLNLIDFSQQLISPAPSRIVNISLSRSSNILAILYDSDEIQFLNLDNLQELKRIKVNPGAKDFIWDNNDFCIYLIYSNYIEKHWSDNTPSIRMPEIDGELRLWTVGDYNLLTVLENDVYIYGLEDFSLLRVQEFYKEIQSCALLADSTLVLLFDDGEVVFSEGRDTISMNLNPNNAYFSYSQTANVLILCFPQDMELILFSLDSKGLPSTFVRVFIQHQPYSCKTIVNYNTLKGSGLLQGNASIDLVIYSGHEISVYRVSLADLVKETDKLKAEMVEAIKSVVNEEMAAIVSAKVNEVKQYGVDLFKEYLERMKQDIQNHPSIKKN